MFCFLKQQLQAQLEPSAMAEWHPETSEAAAARQVTQGLQWQVSCRDSGYVSCTATAPCMCRRTFCCTQLVTRVCS